ncbi:MAG: hypothetical protein KBA81_07780, partial [Rhabdochlamydiaceae bacterium]|nr:hypothetical protein [Rhabdochlamydiaceae bacterium]
MHILTKSIKVLIVLLLCAACSSKTHEGLSVNIGGEPHTLDPRRARELQPITLTKMFFEGLTRLNPEE